MKQNILVVDDQTENIDILYDLLSDEYDISATTTPKNFIKIFNQRIPDLILLDIMMPEIDGYEILRELKKIDPLIDIPVIFVTAKNDSLSEEKGFKLGAVDYISKPFNPVILKARIKTHLALREKNQKLEEMISKKDAEILNNKFNNLLNNIDQGVLSFDLDLNIEDGYSKETLSFFKKEELHNKKIDELLFNNLQHEKKIFNKAINMLKHNDDPSYVQMCLSIQMGQEEKKGKRKSREEREEKKKKKEREKKKGKKEREKWKRGRKIANKKGSKGKKKERRKKRVSSEKTKKRKRKEETEKEKNKTEGK
eukprot:Anaeramoba_ignava/a221126_5.p1 GENE.a221126_5~~a221126_5.p1  ORF type:complete len:310 (-),score=26.54 a221126_5:59-988(-)